MAIATTPSMYHQPVLVDEVLEGLAIEKGGWYIDGTLGGGGHTEHILQAGGNVLGIDQDDDALEESSRRLKSWIEAGNLRLAKSNFSSLAEVSRQHGLTQVQGVLLDLGVSSHQLDQASRGFRFDAETLDMRMDQTQPVTAADLIARLGERDLSTLFADLGEERYARHFAKVIVEARQHESITSAKQLADLLYQASPANYRRGPIHPATRVFQALRLAVNAELESLQAVLPQAESLLARGGRLAVISFHSLEDRIVKHFLLKSKDLRPVTKKPIMASQAELERNSRSRSAKLRVGEKV